MRKIIKPYKLLFSLPLASCVAFATSCSTSNKGAQENEVGNSKFDSVKSKVGLNNNDFNLKGYADDVLSNINEQWIFDNRTKLLSDATLLIEVGQIVELSKLVDETNETIINLSFKLKDDLSIDSPSKKFDIYISGFNRRLSSSSDQDTNAEWQGLPNGSRAFSEKNSFKIQLQIGNGRGVRGTAWSWYYQKNSEYLYDWYLMTNFHVINSAVAYVTNNYVTNENGQQIDGTKLLDYYSKNVETELPIKSQSYYFALEKYSYANNGYLSVVNSTISSSTLSSISSVKIITDFNNDSVDLFSKANSNGSSNDADVSYNMDMALVKISFDFTNNKNLLNKNELRPNVVDLYRNDNSQIFSQTSKIYIAGNPAESDRLIGSEFGPNYSGDYGLTGDEDKILGRLKAPYVYTYDFYNDFKLKGGASGSAVYQFASGKEYEDNVPVGIYWGGIGTMDQSLFKPSLIPFVISFKDAQNVEFSSNIFENFIEWMKKNNSI